MRNKYSVSMDKIKTSQALKNKILLEINESQKKPYKKYTFAKYASYAAVGILCIVGVQFMSQNRVPDHTNPPLVVNPVQNIDDVEELRDKLAFDLKMPSFLLDGYEIVNLSLIQGNVAHIIFSDGINNITYRVGEQAEDLSGDYRTYENVVTESILDYKVELKANSDLYYAASWKDGGISYAITSVEGLDKDTMMAIIKSIID